MTSNLIHWGWTTQVQASFAPFAAQGWQPGRVVTAHRHLYTVATAEGEVLASVSGRLRHEADGPQAFPAVGDWVALEPPQGEGRAVLQAVLPRLSVFSRLAAGTAAAEQVVAANVDTVFLVGALNRDFNLRRLERYVAAAWESGAQPVLVLTKADLCESLSECRREAEAIAPGVPVHAVSSLTGEGLDELAPYMLPGRTVALLGSSGAGKSTLLNRLAGEEQAATGAVRDGDDRGRHTTTRRELFRLPGGALLIDTPGMRELGLWDAQAGLSQAFEEVKALSAECRFRDCHHESETGCAVKLAVAEGRLDSERLASYHKLGRELAHQARQMDGRARLEEKARWKQIHKAMRNFSKG